jgi:hypothetical protein
VAQLLARSVNPAAATAAVQDAATAAREEAVEG